MSSKPPITSRSEPAGVVRARAVLRAAEEGISFDDWLEYRAARRLLLGLASRVAAAVDVRLRPVVSALADLLLADLLRDKENRHE